MADVTYRVTCAVADIFFLYVYTFRKFSQFST